MRATIIPAQITTVEDRIIANLNLTQIILLICSLFLSAFIYSAFSPKLELSLIKAILLIIIMSLFGILALRIKGKLVINWIFILINYYFRPLYYIYDKNDLTTREDIFVMDPKKEKILNLKKEQVMRKITLPLEEIIKIESLITNPNTNLTLKFKK